LTEAAPSVSVVKKRCSTGKSQAVSIPKEGHRLGDSRSGGWWIDPTRQNDAEAKIPDEQDRPSNRCLRRRDDTRRYLTV